MENIGQFKAIPIFYVSRKNKNKNRFLACISLTFYFPGCCRVREKMLADKFVELKISTTKKQNGKVKDVNFTELL